MFRRSRELKPIARPGDRTWQAGWNWIVWGWMLLGIGALVVLASVGNDEPAGLLAAAGCVSFAVTLFVAGAVLRALADIIALNSVGKEARDV